MRYKYRRVIVTLFEKRSFCSFGNSLIAIMLGCLEINIDECIDAFTGMMDEIFKQKAKIPLKLFSGGVKPRYDSVTLERCNVWRVGTSTRSQKLLA